MSPFPLLVLAALLQEPAELTPGPWISGAVASNSPTVTTPTLERDYKNAPTVGITYLFKPPQSGPYFIYLRSFAFDSYLILQTEDGQILLEDDDGFVGSHSRFQVSLDQNSSYRIVACALHGKRGEFEIKIASPESEFVEPGNRWQLLERNLIAKTNYFVENDGADSIRAAYAKVELGIHYYQLKQHNKADAIYRQSLEIIENRLGPEHLSTLNCVSNLGLNLLSMQRAEEAVPLLRRVAETRAKILGPTDQTSMFALGNLGRALHEAGNAEEAQACFEKALGLQRQAVGSDHPATAWALMNLADLWLSLEEWERAIPHYRECLAIRIRSFGANHFETSTAQFHLARALFENGNLAEAKSLAEQSMHTRRARLGDRNPETHRVMNEFGHYLRQEGKVGEAYDIYYLLLQLQEATPNIEQHQLGRTLNILGILCHQLGRFEDARLYLERALSLRRSIPEGVEMDIGDTLNNLGLVYNDLGFPDQAREFLDEAVQIKIAAKGIKNLTTLRSLHNLGVVYADMKRNEQARQIFEQVLEVRRQVLGDAHEDTAKSLMSLANSLTRDGEIESAKRHLQEAMDIFESCLGPMHPDTANCHAQTGLTLAFGKEHEAALKHYLRAYQIQSESLGVLNPFTILTLRNIAANYFHLGQHENALDYYRRHLESTLDYLDRELPFLPESERIRLVEISAMPQDILLCSTYLPMLDLRQDYELFQRWKGKSMRLQKAVVALNAKANNSEYLQKKGQIQALSERLSEVVLLPKPQQSADHAERIRAYREERLKLERELNQITQYASITQTPKLDRVQSGMPPNSALVDFSVGDFVFAWVLRPEGDPKLLSLGRADSLLALQTEFLKKHAVRGGRPLKTSSDHVERDLYQALWAPIVPLLSEAKTVFICPDDFLCELPFGTLQDKDGTFLLEHYRFSYLTDPTLFATSGQIRTSPEGSLLAVGGVNYFQRAEAPAGELATRTSRSRVGGVWSSLPATRLELQSLRDLKEFILGWQQPWTFIEGKDATEECLRRELPGNKYIHLATHGYFEPDHLPSLIEHARQHEETGLLKEQVSAVGMLPGLLSGLVLAGVNADPDPDRDDGYLSAEEIQHIDLTACDLVVLSACETALGSARSGEGLMSLRRAFSVAGATSVVSSLWKVDDQATAELVKRFYHNLWQESMSKLEAMHQAKLWMLKRNRLDNEGDGQPQIWGAFVLSGDWR